MPIAYFPSLEQAETIEIAFSRPQGGEEILRLLVDSGFIGQSHFVLPESLGDLAQAPVTTSQAAGAIQGTQTRVAVSCKIVALSFEIVAIAILADMSALVLPPEVQGIVGLRFLRQFRRWGAEQNDDGSWRFFLEIDKM